MVARCESVRLSVGTRAFEVQAKNEGSPYQLFMLALCLWALLSLAAGTVLSLDAETLALLEIADNAVCGLFLVDFVLNLYRAPAGGPTW